MDFISDSESVCSTSDSSASEDASDEEYIHENSHPNATPQKAAAAKKGGRSRNNKTSTNDATATAKSSKKTIEQTYQKKTQLEHILLRPDTYIGSTEQITQPMFVLNAETQRIESRDVTFTPGFYKIFDEIIVNAADNKQRDPDMDRMEVTVDAETNTISVKNTGKGIPVVMHKEHDCYVPTLIFGHLLTGSNFDDNEKKTTGGRNGYGAKLANIFSTKFIVECCDSESGQKFTQVFRDNMRKAEEPKITEWKKDEDYTKITFRPDLDKFNMSCLDDDAIGLISKRAYDIAGAMGKSKCKKLSVYLNGTKLPVKDFKSYLALFDGVEMPTAYEKTNTFEVGVTVSHDGCFQQISFVNGIATTKGGGHVNFIADKIVKHIQPILNKKNKGGMKITPGQIKNHLSVFVNCLVENPTFDSQTKENLTTKPAVIGKEVILSDKFLKQVEKDSGIIESVMNYTKFKQNLALKKNGGTKKKKLNIDKLDDANYAGSTKSKDCTLIITEGDSAKSLAMSGLSVVGRDYYGVFPLKGKPLNVREATHAQIMKNQEIKNLIDIMGLKHGTKYDEKNIKTLRYGHLMIMADQDHDGSHIKGLVINFIHHFWPTLLDVPGFLQQFITPIVKCTKGKKTETFFTLPEYEEWKTSTGNDGKGWKIKYYKGLGTSTSAEAKEYFSNLDIHEINFNSISDDVISLDEEDETMTDATATGSALIDLAFSKKKVNERKLWLNSIEKDTYLNYSEAQKDGLNFSDFINQELALYSRYDNTRSIAHVMDGLKPSQRKILFSCFKKKLKSEIKVAQLAGYIGEHSAYHHGEASLAGAIIGMAQTYVGSNNVNLLYPSGQFGTRRMGGKDHASPRYIFTKLEKITRAIFHPDDDALLNFLNDDGMSIEPEYYMPVIPLVLVNGSDGIGTGWSSTVHNHDPREVIANLKKMIHGEELEMIHPCFYGFTGEVIQNKEGTYIITGKIERTDDTTLVITELPIGKWTQDYKSFLESMMTGTDKSASEISDFKEHHTDTSISFTITASKENIDAFEEHKGGLLGKFKLSKSLSSTNMTLFDVDGKIKKYKSTMDILRTFFSHRLDFYDKRKDMLLENMRKDLKILTNKERFIEEVCRGELVVNNRKRSELLSELSERGYDIFPKDEKPGSEEDDDDDDDGFVIVQDTPSDAELAKGYEYLLGLKLWTLTFERAEGIRRQKKEKEAEVEDLASKTPESIWLFDLDTLDEALVERNEALDIAPKKAVKSQSKSASKKRANKQMAKSSRKKPTETKKKKKQGDEWDSEMEESESESDGAVSDSDDEFFEDLKASPPKKRKTEAKSRPNSIGKQKMPVLATRTQQRKRISMGKAEGASSKDMLVNSDSDEFQKRLSASKIASKKKKTQPDTDMELMESDDEYPTPKKASTSRRSSSKHGMAMSPKKSANGKQKIAILGTRKQQRKSISMQQAESDTGESPKKMPANKKRATKRKKSSILKQALDAEIELVDSDDESPSPKKTSSDRMKTSSSRKKESFARSDSESDFASESVESPSPKKTSSDRMKTSSSRKKESFARSDSESDFASESVSIASTPKPRKGRSKRRSKLGKSICHLSSDESDGYESAHSDVSFAKPVKAKASGRKRHKITKPTRTFESSEDEFEF